VEKRRKRKRGGKNTEEKEGERGKRNQKEGGDGFGGVGAEEGRCSREEELISTTPDRHECFQFFITCKRTDIANNATHYLKLGKKRRESSKCNYYIISSRLKIKAIIMIATRNH